VLVWEEGALPLSGSTTATAALYGSGARGVGAIGMGEGRCSHCQEGNERCGRQDTEARWHGYLAQGEANTGGVHIRVGGA
jgi:hypothetical protein